jgi:hypothetical protein
MFNKHDYENMSKHEPTQIQLFDCTSFVTVLFSLGKLLQNHSKIMANWKKQNSLLFLLALIQVGEFLVDDDDDDDDNDKVLKMEIIHEHLLVLYSLRLLKAINIHLFIIFLFKRIKNPGKTNHLVASPNSY